MKRGWYNICIYFGNVTWSKIELDKDTSEGIRLESSDLSLMN